ncbi:hypothetical protein SLS62_001468 [Diatrype stigma]|uniref:Ribosome quality control complex subunit 2 n=1 Tax=Diatrype stigma TaxID=117547 RepID=A0AAN9V025_9PEZI
MKQRFSSLDVKVIAHELSAALVSLRLSNIYDLSSKILLLKFAKPGLKQQLVIDSGFRCHLTDFSRTTAAFPSVFVQKLRKVLNTRRVTAISQIGTDRIIEFQFSDGQYRVYLEFFAGGNVILTDNELKILTLLRNVPEGEGQEPQRPGLTYSLQNRQNYGGVPPLTKDRLRDALQTIVRKATNAATGKIKKKQGDALRKGLATTITELPPILVDHTMRVAGFDSAVQPATVLESDALQDHLLQALHDARKIIDDITGSATCTGYILAKKRGDAESNTTDVQEDQENKPADLLYEDFHPFIPRQFEEDPAYTVVTFDNYNKMVDEFFSSIEGQRLKSKLTEKEAAAKRKLEAAKADQAKRIEGLKSTQEINVRKAQAIEANVERIEEAMDAVNSLIEQGMDWVDIGKLVERERGRNNPVARIIKLPLKLHENTITLLLGEAEEDEEEDDGDETDSSVSDSGYVATEASKQKAPDRWLEIDINLGLSPLGNARQYYGEKKMAAVKEGKTAMQSKFALRSAEQKIAAELKKGLKLEKPTLQQIRKQMWFEKFTWFISSDGYLVLGGKDASQNEMLYRRYLRKGDIYVHADLHGAPSVIIKNNPSTPDAPIPPSTLSQAGSLAVCASSAWDSKAMMAAWWVNADQVSKAAPTGEYLPTGSFMVRDKKNFLPPTQLLLGFAIIFRISDESKAKHIKHRLHGNEGVASLSTTTPLDADALGTKAVEENLAEDAESDSGDSAVDVSDGDYDQSKANPLQPTDHDDAHEDAEAQIKEAPLQEAVHNLATSEEPSGTSAPEPEPGSEPKPTQSDEDKQDSDIESDIECDTETTLGTASAKPSGSVSSKPATPQPQKKPKQAKRGQRGKAKKIAAKYKDQDEEDRAAIEALIGASAGRQKAEAEAKAKAEREAQLAATKERRRAQHERQQRETAQHEEVRRLLLEEGVETLDADEAAQELPVLDALVGTPRPGDEILEAVAVCAPYAALGRCKYRVKLQPGTQKKGKAVKEILERWKADAAVAAKKGWVDEEGRDVEKMWPREIELLKAFKPEEAINCVPVGKLRVVMSGGAGGSGGGGGAGGSGGVKGKKGGAGARGKKK